MLEFHHHTDYKAGGREKRARRLDFLKVFLEVSQGNFINISLADLDQL